MVMIKVKQLHQDAKLPVYGSDGAACFDLCCIGGGTVPPHASAVFDSGLSFSIPTGYAMLIYSRSGHGFNNGITLVNGTGIIDSDYRGPVKIGLRNGSMTTYTVNAGERIAQGMIIPLPSVQFELAQELDETVRGTGGFGSTGK